MLYIILAGLVSLSSIAYLQAKMAKAKARSRK